jgi:hypothetical protein
MTKHSARGIALVAAVLTAVSAWVLSPPAHASAPSAGYRLVASAAAGSVYVNDPTFLVPYADQILSQADSEVSAVGASAVATPLQPGSVVSLVPTLLVVGCPTCPSVPSPVNLKAEARPPANEHQDAAAGGAAGGPVTVGGPQASASAEIGAQAVATASTASIAGLDQTPAISSTDSRATLQVPTDSSDGLAESRARTGFGGVAVVALASVLPTVQATAGIEQADGTIVPIPSSGMPIGDGRLLPSMESGAGFARAGVVFERTDPSGTVVRSTLVLTSVQLLGVFESAPPADDPSPAVPPVQAASSPALGAPATRSSSGFAATPATASTFVAPDPARAALASARTDRFGRVRDRLWLLWLYAAWLVLGALVMSAGRRYLAPLLASQAAIERRARAGRVDHLDAGGG